jgi:carboxypeptidase Taq
MADSFQTLLGKLHEVHDLSVAGAIMSWDREVNMPKAGMTSRIKQMTTLHRLVHSIATSDEVGELIEAASAEVDGADYDSFEASLIREARRSYDDARKLPDSFVARMTEVSGKAHQAWVEARENDDFDTFRPWLEQVIELAQEMSELYGYDTERYDALLDKFERDMKTEDVRHTFEALKAETVPLIRAIAESDVSTDDTLLHQPYDVDEQKAFARYAAEAVGYDFTRGHLGTAVHPFATSFSRDDTRITTRWYAEFLNPSLFGTMHESGHAMYEQGTAPELARTLLARGTSMGFHESQSRMMENLVGRSRGFWQAHYGALQDRFPVPLGDVDVEAFYRAINKVQPSLIRVEADELTYNLHIVLRFELEQAMLSGDLAAVDVPDAWNAKMEELLGIVPPSDREGCLQDVHWTRPMFGYFPTYALGNLYAAQLFEAALDSDPEIGAELAQGRTRALVAWLHENVHRHGKKFPPAELIVRATGQPLTHEAFTRYARAKFGAIYDL